jgi:hypothetical protein
MALPTTSLSFSALQTEFGGDNPISLSEYVRGGLYVPSGTTSSYGTIPTTNSNINMGVFRGTQKVVELVNISNHTINTSRTSYGDGPSSALSEFRLFSNGGMSLVGSVAWFPDYSVEGFITIDGSDYFSDTLAGSTATVPVTNEWLQSGTPSLYSARATIISSDTPNGSTQIRYGTFGSWVAITSDLNWGVIAASTDSQRSASMDTIFTLDIALTSNLSNILDTATITLQSAAQTFAGEIP